MKIYALMIFLVFGFAQSQDKCDKTKIQKNDSNAEKKMPEENKDIKYDRLPDGVKLTDEVREEIKGEKGDISYQIITVREKLKDLGAKYEGEKLVDSKGREIKFYKPPVRGTSQGFEEDKIQRELDEKEFRELKEKYTVIVLYVNPLKVS